MAKKNTVLIDVVVNGQMKKVSVDAAKLGVQLDNVGKSAHTADRNLKGAAQASANGTKNFSKMSQGVGGLVGVYATLAATAFAVSAAFEFFKKVADFRVLQDSQVAYASSTGVALKTLTTDIRAATDGMLEFQEASQAAAIGVASGLTPKQLTDLATGASAVSKILGRDVSDSFDRLVRGVTKAEPELLDELGITLRLEDAKRKFAIQVNKTAKSLSLLEQKQAVALEVQTQLNEKFIATSEAIEIQDNAVKRLGVAFSDVFNSISNFLSGPIEGIANFLANNIASFIAVIGLFATSVLSSMLPSLGAFVDGVQKSADEASDALKKAKDDLEELKETGGASATVQTALKDVKAEKGSGIDRLRNQENLSKRQAATLLRFAKQEKGVYRQLTMYQKQVYKKALRDILGEKDKFTSKVKRSFYRLGDELAIVAKRIERRWKQAMSKMTSMAAGATKRIVGGFKKVAGAVTAIVIAVQLFVGLIRSIPGMGDTFKAPPELQALSNRIEDITSRLQTMSTEFAKAGEAIDKHLTKVSSRAGTAVTKTMTSIQTLTKFGTSVIPQFLNLSDVLEDVIKAREAMQEQGGGSPQGKGVELLRSIFQGVSLDAQNAVESAQKLGVQLSSVLKSSGISSTPITAFLGTLKDLDSKNLTATTTRNLIKFAEALPKLGDEFALQQQNITAFNESLKASNEAFTQLVQSNAKYKTSATDLLEITYKEIEASAFRTDNLGNLIELTDDYSEAIKKNLIQRLAYLNLIKAAETDADYDKTKNEIEYNKALRFATPLLKERAETDRRLLDMKADINQKASELAVIESEMVPGDEKRIETLKAQLGLMMLQRDALEEQQKVMNQLGQAGLDGLERGMSSQISALLKGEESSGRDAVLNMIKSAAESVADELANQMTESAMKGIRGLLGIEEEKTAAQLMEEAILRGGEETARLWELALAQAGLQFEEKRQEAIVNKKQGMIDPIDDDGNLKTSSMDRFIDRFDSLTTTGRMKVELPPKGEGPLTPEVLKEQGIPEPEPPLVLKKNNRTERTSIESTQENSGVVDNLTDSTGKLDVSTKGLSITMDQVGQTFASGIGALMASLGGGGAGGIVMGALGQIASAFVGAKFGAAARSGAILEGYSAGGIAKGREAGYPAILHGTEAVVPLPNGKQIPVEMKGGAGQQNNISVNVNVNNEGGATSEVEGDQGGQNLGRAIAGAVQQELMNQKRAGGILSPYGAS